MSFGSSQPHPLTVDNTPAGFLYCALRAGIKPSGKPDFACAQAVDGTTAAAVFTGNRVVAAPILVGREHLQRSGGKVRLVAVNAGNANCATGQKGVDACRAVCAAAAKEFDCSVDEVFPSSTGIIGVQLPAEKLVAALPQIAAQLGATPAHIQQFAEAIMTTDTRAKIAVATLEVEGRAVRILGIAKGAGMIGPQLVANTPAHATMLVYLFTDAKIASPDLQRFLQQAIEPTFNCISIDGDTSTNDTVLLLASGSSEVQLTASANGPASRAFADALGQVCASLARQIVDDGEGVEHVIELHVEGASSPADAKCVARSVAHSPLVKTAFAGCDPNWGRILAAIGYSGVPIDPAKVSIWIADLPVCVEGQVSPNFDAAAVHRAMQQRDVAVRIDLGMGAAAARFLTADLTAEYVRVNAEYST